MWIRSQDKKTLMKVVYLNLDDKKIFGIGHLEDCELILGKYQSTHRAMEILNSIQNRLASEQDVKTIVIEMPEV